VKNPFLTGNFLELNSPDTQEIIRALCNSQWQQETSAKHSNGKPQTHLRPTLPTHKPPSITGILLPLHSRNLSALLLAQPNGVYQASGIYLKRDPETEHPITPTQLHQQSLVSGIALANSGGKSVNGKRSAV